MFEIGSNVIYGTEGICKISDIAKLSFNGIGEAKDYYVLVPVLNSTYKVYVPVDNEHLVAKMQKLLTYDEIIELINDENNEIEWVNDNKIRNKRFKEIIASYDRRKIFMLAKLIYNAKNGKIENVKKIYASDEEILKKLVHILHAEISYVVPIEESDLLSFICEKNQKYLNIKNSITRK